MSGSQLRVGIIGAGDVARTCHLPAWQKVPEARIVALADPADEALSSAASLVDGELRVANDYRHLLDDRDIDIVDICTPSALHAEVTVAALASGKHVLCEKPLATTLPDARAVLAACRRSDRHYQTALHLRLDRGAMALRQTLHDLSAGHIYFTRAQWLRRRRLPGRPGFTSKALSGGGPLFDLGVHIFDLSWWLIGCPQPSRVSGMMSSCLARRNDLGSEWGDWDHAAIDVEDFAAGWIRFDNGAVLSLETCWIALQGETDMARVEILGERAGGEWPAARVFGETKRRPWDLQLPVGRRQDRPRHEVIRRFAGTILRDEPSVVTPEEAATTIAVLAALEHSSQTGAEVLVEPIEPAVR